MTGSLVVDTNVVVAGLITGTIDSPVRRLLDGMLVGTFRFLLSRDLLAEYRRVLLRSAILKRHRLTDDQVDAVLTVVAANAQIRDTIVGQALQAPDPGDDHQWRPLQAMPGLILVTGDRRLIEQPPHFASVVSPRTALALIKD